MGGVIDLRNPVNRCHPLARGLVAWWTCLLGWTGGVKWYDLCGLNAGTLTNMNSSASGWRGTTRPGGYGHLLFDGVDDGVSTPVVWSASYTNITVAAWCQTTTAANVDFVANYSGSGRSDIELGVLGGKSQFFLRDHAQAHQINCVGSKTINDGKWHLVTGVLNGATGSVYVDGLFDGSVTTAGFTGVMNDNPGFHLGQDANGTSLLAGSLDDVRLYSRALSSAEVKSLYDNSRLGCPGLLNRVDYRLLSPTAGLVTSRKVGLGGLSGLGGVSGVF